MSTDTSHDYCRICGGQIDPCPIPIGAHLLCTASAECRHELCLLLAGDTYDNDDQDVYCIQVGGSK